MRDVRGWRKKFGDLAPSTNTPIDASSFAVVAQVEIIRKLRRNAFRLDLANWLEYHRVRYGW